MTQLHLLLRMIVMFEAEKIVINHQLELAGKMNVFQIHLVEWICRQLK